MMAFSDFGVFHRLRTLGLVTILFAPTMASAEEDGQITLILADERLELPLNTGHSDWTGSRGFAKVSILTRPTDLETWERFQSLRLAFELLRNRAEMPEMSLLRRTDVAFERWYGRADDGGLTVMVTYRSLEGDVLSVSGTFDGNLGQSGDFGQTIDLSKPMPVSGTFEVRLLPIR
jgi:hypothetical protein